MSATTYDVLKVSFTPGLIETFEKHAEGKGNLAWSGIFKGVKDTRNSLFVSVGITALGASSLAFSLVRENQTAQFASVAAITLGVGLTGLSAKRFWNAVLVLRNSLGPV